MNFQNLPSGLRLILTDFGLDRYFQEPTPEAPEDNFENAANWRPEKPVKAPVTRPQPDPTYHGANLTSLLRRLQTTHPMRVARIVRDLRWLDRKGRKYGIKVLR